MPRKRMILSLDEELHKVLMDVSEATGQPAASFVAGILEEMKPQFIKISEMVALAKKNAVDEAYNVLKGMSDEASKELKDYKNQVEDADPSKTKKEPE